MKAEGGRNRRIRNRMYGGEGGRRAQALLLGDIGRNDKKGG